MRISNKGSDDTSEQWEKVGNWTQGEKGGRVSGVLSAPLPLLIGIGGPVKRSSRLLREARGVAEHSKKLVKQRSRFVALLALATRGPPLRDSRRERGAARRADIRGTRHSQALALFSKWAGHASRAAPAAQAADLTALTNVASDFADLRFYEGLAELPLAYAAAVDPLGHADDAHARHANHAAARAARTRCYAAVTDALAALSQRRVMCGGRALTPEQ
eukprot:1182687-Prorocentrum_minimum.AAC.4